MIIPIHSILPALQNLLNSLNLIIFAFQRFRAQNLGNQVPPVPDVINLIEILLSGLQLIIEGFEKNRKLNKAHVLIKFVRGYRYSFKIVNLH